MANFFTYEERLTLQKLLKEGLSFKKIAAQLGKDPSTISREVRKYAVEIATGKPGYSFNACKNRMTCKIKAPALCGKECTRKGSSGTVCRLDDCLLEVRNIDLPRKVRFRARRKKPEFKVDKGCRVGRSYKEFEAFMEKNPDTAVVQMDSVIGSIGGKCLPTIHFVESSMMLAFLRDANTSQSMIDVFEWLDDRLGGKRFNQLFPVIVTDNGSEFSNPKKIEYRDYAITGYGFRRTSIYYCDAGCPYQKGAIEVNHELIRRVLPKGTSFDNLTQKDVTRMMNHINSYKRKKLNDRSPYETFSFHYGEEVLRLLGCTPVAAEDILLKPTLLK